MTGTQEADGRMRRLAVLGGFLPVLAGAAGLASAVPAAEPVALAVAAFDFRDTSGEVRNQADEHEARLKALGAAVNEGLSATGKVGLVGLGCGAGACTVRAAGLDALSAHARKVGAHYLLIGEVHKLSTLIGEVKFAVLDMDTGRPTCDRFLSYRGDTDEAWRRAAAFVVRDVEKHCIP
ncbi:DUF2380 domain-containing protein [Rhizobium binxianense]